MRSSRLLAITLLLCVLVGLFVWAGAMEPDPDRDHYPGTADLAENYDAYVGEYAELAGEVELRANGETIATFDSPEAVFEDADAYPATEKDISNFSEWSEIKRPAFPPGADIVDVIAVTDDGLRVLEDEEETPLDELSETTEQQQGGLPGLDF